MTNEEIFSHVDHTLLKPTAGWEEIRTLCREAMQYHTASVCVPPCYVRRIRQEFPDLTICTVIGFPLGYHTKEAKLFEACRAVLEGVDELDMVVNVADVKNGDMDAVTKEIAELKTVAGTKILKVIIETCYLEESEKIALCKAVTEAGADYIKTSTGFGPAGAALADIELFRTYCGKNVKIKAAGGIRTQEEMIAYLEAGCDRIGTSGAVKVLAP